MQIRRLRKFLPWFSVRDRIRLRTRLPAFSHSSNIFLETRLSSPYKYKKYHVTLPQIRTFYNMYPTDGKIHLLFPALFFVYQNWSHRYEQLKRRFGDWAAFETHPTSSHDFSSSLYFHCYLLLSFLSLSMRFLLGFCSWHLWWILCSARSRILRP